MLNEHFIIAAIAYGYDYLCFNPRYYDDVLLTPSIFWKNKINIFNSIQAKCLIIASTSDKNYSEVEWKSLSEESNVQFFEIENADHSLETGNIDMDLDIVKIVLHKIKTFITV